jgi:hypothetical protein
MAQVTPERSDMIGCYDGRGFYAQAVENLNINMAQSGQRY